MQKNIIYKNAQISFSNSGKGPAIVLIHGFLENATMWKDIAPELSKNNNIITVDLLGHGKSDCLGYVHTMETFAETIAAVLQHLKIRKCMLIGHSLGGYVALAFAEKYPQKIKGLCLLNSTSNEDSEERKEIRTRANKMVQNNFNAMVKLSVANLFDADNLSIYKEEIKAVKAEALKTTLQGYIAAQEGMKIRENRNHILEEGSFKKLFIMGDKDPILNFNSLIDEAKMTHSDFIILKGGHMPHIENKNELIDVLINFTKK